jgi:ATP-binding cassette subfamily C protein CydC
LVLLAAIAAVRFFAIFRAASRYAERLMTHDATFRSLAHLKVRIFDRLAASPPIALLGAGRGDWLRRASADVDRLQRVYADGLAPVLILGVLTLALILWLSAWGWALAAVGGGLLVLAGALLPTLVWRLQRSRKGALVQGEARLATALVDTVQGLADRLATDRPARIGDGLAQLSEVTLARERQLDRIQAVGDALLTGAGVGAAFFVLAAAVPAVRAGRLPGVLVATVVLGVMAAFEAIRPMPAAAAALGETEAAAERLSLAEPLPAAAAPSRLPADTGYVGDHLWLRYHPDSPWVLEDVSFRLPVGTQALLMGPSGEGKSSLLAMLARLISWQDGSLAFGGVPLNAVDDGALRAHVGLLLQRPHLFNASLRDNLRLARRDASDAELRSALHVVGLDEWAASLPAGLDTSVGELGQRLSGGERRRLALAQLVVQDAAVWLLDEPLAGLDNATADDVARRLRRLADGRTVLIASHDPLPGWTFDVVWRLADGRLQAE